MVKKKRENVNVNDAIKLLLNLKEDIQDLSYCIQTKRKQFIVNGNTKLFEQWTLAGIMIQEYGYSGLNEKQKWDA